MKEKRRNKQRRTKERILLAARELAQQNGFENLSLRGIARRVDYSPASLYEYFESKDAIIDALCEETDLRLAEFMQGESESTVVDLACRYIQFANDYPDDFQLLYRRPMLPAQNDQVFTVLFEQIKNNAQVSMPQEFAYSIWAMAHGIALLSINRGIFEDSSIHRRMFQQLLKSYQ